MENGDGRIRIQFIEKVDLDQKIVSFEFQFINW